MNDHWIEALQFSENNATVGGQNSKSIAYTAIDYLYVQGMIIYWC